MPGLVTNFMESFFAHSLSSPQFPPMLLAGLEGQRARVLTNPASHTRQASLQEKRVLRERKKGEEDGNGLQATLK